MIIFLSKILTNYITRWFDVTFLVSATATLALLYLAHKREPVQEIADKNA